jgi:hypothetical protein
MLSLWVSRHIKNNKISQRLPTLAPPEYLSIAVQASSDSNLKFYTLALGLSNNLKLISPEVDTTRKYNGGFLPTNIPATFIDPLLVRSEAWSSYGFGKPSKKSRWI